MDGEKLVFKLKVILSCPDFTADRKFPSWESMETRNAEQQKKSRLGSHRPVNVSYFGFQEAHNLWTKQNKHYIWHLQQVKCTNNIYKSQGTSLSAANQIQQKPVIMYNLSR